MPETNNNNVEKLIMIGIFWTIMDLWRRVAWLETEKIMIM
jgi:hypothetical protein